ncbi:MAG: hypothetical protein JWO54_486 [Candidatus Saccharibacteria bacterium]|nr:hypothetical protein [Candidatus Saccharibacteria bacterium]MDB5180726.1 hypothetical protein [Candidatus Saccharibacteria bacterium]
MNRLTPETISPTPLSLAEQAFLDRQNFDGTQRVRTEQVGRKLLALLSPTVSEQYSWLKTTNPTDHTNYAQGLVEIKQLQQAILLEKGEYPDGPGTYRNLQYAHRMEAVGTAVLVSEALMGGDVLNGTVPIMDEILNNN